MGTRQDGDLDQDRDGRDGEQVSVWGCNLKIELVEFSEWLAVDVRAVSGDEI